MKRRSTQTKIIATIGPACSSIAILKKMFQEGIDVCRLNFSHGTQEDHLKVIKTIGQLNRELNGNVAILADLQGPKLRIGDVENNGVELVDGNSIEITIKGCLGTAERICMSYREFPRDVSVGDDILIDDGKLKLEVISTNRIDTVQAKIVHGGVLSSKKGVNLPKTTISLPSLTEKDIKDAHFALEHGADWIALSFVRTVTDIIDLKEIIKKKKKSARVIAKIEKPEALEEIDNIIDMADGIMIARGDLGVEVEFDRVPLIQKTILRKCIEQSKPVIIATQMMESMIHNFRPTRAETNDVATAVLDGADCLMLSGETSVGKYPVEVIRSMQKIIDWTERNGFQFIREHAPMGLSKSFLPDSICYNACKMAEQTQAKAIITFTHSGYTAFRISSHRPDADIYAFTNNRKIMRILSLVWGVRAYYLDEYKVINDAIESSVEILMEKESIQEDDTIIHVGTIPLNKRGQTNMIKISYV
ncbi:MAG: pyruvate kinase [Bacteroidales bacterium]|nr:MAG: pyruvate kinase [Bacteroidales bacterium]